MKLRYELEYIETDGILYAVPIGEDSFKFKGLIQINEESKEALKLIRQSSTPEEVLEKLLQNHPEENKDELAKSLCDFLNVLLKNGILEP